MIRQGAYTIYNNKEYRVIIRDREGKSYLLSSDIEDLKFGFKKYAERVYEREIDLNDLNELYYIDSKAKYNNHFFSVRTFIKDGTVCIGTGDAKLAQELNFKRTDKYLYEKWVPKEDVEIIEERKDIPIEKNRCF